MNETLSKATVYLDVLFSQLFSKLIVAVVILLIGFVIGRMAGKLLHRFLTEIDLNKILKKAGIAINLETTLSHLATYFIYFVTIIWALESMGLTTTILNLISIAFLVLIIISISLAIKDFFPNMIAGLFIHQKGLIKKGDKVKIDNVKGTVRKINLIETEIKTPSGDIIYIPNSIVTKKEILVKKK